MSDNMLRERSQMKRKIIKRKINLGFTLVEMLVVLVIIGILAGLISAAALHGVRRAKVARIGAEIHQLSLALNHYKTKFGEYPSDFTNVTSPEGQAIVLRHVRRAYPRYIVSDWSQLTSDVSTGSNGIINLNNMTPATALVFWLGGMPELDSSGTPTGRCIGFSQNPANPFDNSTSRIGPFYEFDPGRLITTALPGQTYYAYYAPGISTSGGQPYVYFRAELGQKYDPSGNPSPREYYLPDLSTLKTLVLNTTVKPYWDDRNSGWVNNTSFQILCCGLDGMFGEENVYPSGQRPTTPTTPSPPIVMGVNDIPSPDHFYYLDDQTNFTSGTIGDDMP
jgi:prepilin-type N-terminal cleavage/methylation domain-containing protein